MIYIKSFTNIDELIPLRAAWNTLASESPLQSWEWFFTWAETMLGNSQLCVAVGKNEDDEVVGIAPFYVERNWATGNILRLMGDQRCCTDYSTLLTKPQHSNAFIAALSKWLVDEPQESNSPEDPSRPSWGLVKLEATHHADSNINSFCRELIDYDCRSEKLQKNSSWQVHFTGNWDDYVATLSKSQRRNVRRVEKRVLQNPDFGTCVAQNQDEFETGMKWFRKLHQKRWAAAGKPGCFSDPKFAKFLETVARRLFERNALRLAWIENSERPIAVDFSFASGSTTYGYQMGVDPDYRKLELGRALQVFSMKSALELGHTTFDFLRGSETYKSRWCAEETKLIDIEIVPDELLPQLRQNMTELGRSLKKKVAALAK